MRLRGETDGDMRRRDRDGETERRRIREMERWRDGETEETERWGK